MAGYTPTQLIVNSVLGNGAANIATWRRRDTSLVNIHRTTAFDSVTAGAAVTLEVGVTAADTAGQRILDAFVLTVNVPSVFNWFIVTNINDYFEAFANGTTTYGQTNGYTWS